MEHILIYFGIFSVILAIVNAIPFPALDGSLPIMLFIEKITKGRINKLLVFIWFAGFTVLMVLQIIVLYFWIFG
jgi:membrane-associated protease RseP (regulator of RpoE activity)